MDWNALTAISTAISMVAFIVTAIFVAAQLKALEKSRYLQITSELYETWQRKEFMEAQLWLIHRLKEKTWAEFVRAHRADYGEQAFHRVGSFYDRVGTLVRLKMIDAQEILSTIGAHAIAVWQQIEPLVREARVLENSLLFDDFERLLPNCYECYVPSLQPGEALKPFSAPSKAALTSVEELRERLEKGDSVAVLDVQRGAPEPGESREHLPEAIIIPPDKVAEHLDALSPGKDVVAYCA